MSVPCAMATSGALSRTSRMAAHESGKIHELKTASGRKFFQLFSNSRRNDADMRRWFTRLPNFGR